MKKRTLLYSVLFVFVILAIGITPAYAAEAQVNYIELDKSYYELGETILINASWYLEYYTYEGWSHGEISYSTSLNDPAIDGTYWQNENSGQIHTHNESYQLNPSDWAPGSSGQLGVARAIAITNDYMGFDRDEAYLNFTVLRAGQNYSVIPLSQPPMINQTIDVEFKIFNEHDEDLELSNHNITYSVYKEEQVINLHTNTTTDTSGHLNVTFDATAGEGNYSLQVYSWLSEDYEELNFTETVYVYQNYTKKPVYLRIQPQQALTFSSLNITTQVEDENQDPIPQLLVELEFQANSTWIPLGSAVTQTDGNAEIHTSIIYASDIYPLRAKTPGNGFYQFGGNMTTLLIIKRNTSLIVNNQTGSSTDIIKIPIHLKDDEQTPLLNKTILGFIQQGQQWSMVGSALTNLTGDAIFLFNATYPSSNYTTKFVFNSTRFYQESQQIIKINIILEQTQINATPIQIYFSQPTQFWVTISDDDYTPVPNHELTLWIQQGLNWQYLQTSTSNLTGQAFFNPNLALDPGNYTMRIIFNETLTYHNSSALTILTILTASTFIQITPIQHPSYVFVNQVITLTLQDQDTNQLPSQAIQIIEKRNGLLIHDTIIQTNATGKLTYIIISPGIEEITILFCFNGTHQYLPCNCTLQFQAQRHQTTLQLEIPSLPLPYTPMIINLTLTIDENIPYANQELQLAISNNQYVYVNQTLITGPNGRVHLTWMPIQELSYTITATYISQTGEHTNASITNIVNVMKITPLFILNITQQRTQIIVQLSVVNPQGEPIANAKINWYVNNSLIQTTMTDIEGNTQLFFNPDQPGTLIFTIEYEGSPTISSHTLEKSFDYHIPPEIEYARLGLIVMVLIPITAIITMKIKRYRSETELILRTIKPSKRRPGWTIFLASL